MIPIGATVDIANHGGRWRGVVTSRPGPYSIEIDGRLTAPANLAKVVGMTEDFMGHRDADSETARVLHMELTAAVAERDALRELVVAQATKNAELAQQIADGVDPIDWERLRVAVRQHFANIFGTFDPTSMDCRAKGIDASDLIEEMARYDG